MNKVKTWYIRVYSRDKKKRYMPTIDNDAPASLHREDLKCCFRLEWTEVNVQISNILSLACS